jgi:hypothetical protein
MQSLSDPAMDLPRALAQIGEIHALLGRSAVYRGYRSVPVAASGIVGFAAAALQPASSRSTDQAGFVAYWTAVAAIAAAIGSSEIIYNYFARDDRAERRKTREAVGQFLPGVIAGTLLTIAFAALDAGPIRLLPALWAFCFALGTFASVPYVPRAGLWVGWYYLAAAAALLWIAAEPSDLTGWHVGCVFGTGQVLAALVLYLKIERRFEP